MTNDIRIVWHKVRRYVRTHWPRCVPGLAANALGNYKGGRGYCSYACSNMGGAPFRLRLPIAVYISDCCACADGRTYASAGPVLYGEIV